MEASSGHHHKPDSAHKFSSRMVANLTVGLGPTTPRQCPCKTEHQPTTGISFSGQVPLELHGPSARGSSD